MKDKYKKKLQNESGGDQLWSRLAHHKKKDEGSVNQRNRYRQSKIENMKKSLLDHHEREKDLINQITDIKVSNAGDIVTGSTKDLKYVEVPGLSYDLVGANWKALNGHKDEILRIQ